MTSTINMGRTFDLDRLPRQLARLVAWLEWADVADAAKKVIDAWPDSKPQWAMITENARRLCENAAHADPSINFDRRYAATLLGLIPDTPENRTALSAALADAENSYDWYKTSDFDEDED